MNRDGMHSSVTVTNFPGLTPVRFDQEGRDRKLDLLIPNVLFPYPCFINCSMAYTSGPYWRSVSRSMVTTDLVHLKTLVKMYLSNQVLVTPSNADTAPVGTNGDVFASITPYWMTTAGRSWSDLPYLQAALEVSRTLPRQTKSELVQKGLLAPTIQSLIRKSLKGVSSEDDYLTAKAHPTALPPKGVDLVRLKALAAALTPAAIPPLAVISVKPDSVESKSPWPELTYGTAFAWAFVLRADADVRTFDVSARGASYFKFVQTHGQGVDVTIVPKAGDAVQVVLKSKGMSPTNRVDIAVFGRNDGTGWGAPSYISFARMDPKAAYSDPALTILDEPGSK